MAESAVRRLVAISIICLLQTIEASAKRGETPKRIGQSTIPLLSSFAGLREREKSCLKWSIVVTSAEHKSGCVIYSQLITCWPESVLPYVTTLRAFSDSHHTCGYTRCTLHDLQ